MIIGLTGQNAAGKGVIASYLQKKSFEYSSLSDVIREELIVRKLEISRKNLINVGNELREKFGPHVLAEKALGKADINKNYVIDSIRNPAEVKYLKGCGCVLLNIDALPEVRFKRITQRNRENDPKTFEEFKEIELLENSTDGAGQQTIECQKLADHNIPNNGTLENLHMSVDNVLNKISLMHERPSWDNYFMNIAKHVASRSNCMKRKVASVIIKDKRIVSTGYNGTPRGVKNCSEGGCERCNTYVDGGTKLSECLCSHGEENAIVQAAYHGISIKGSVLYSTFSPCLICTKMIINSGIKEVIYNEKYPMNDIIFRLFKEASIELRKLNIK